MANLFRLRVDTEYLRFLLKRNRRFMLLMSSAMLVLYPILTVTIRAISGSDYVQGFRTTGQIFNLILLIVSAFILPLLLLSYLNRKKDLDVYHALPIKQTDLLVTNILAAWILMLIPFTVGWMVGGLLNLDATFTWVRLIETWASSLLIATAIEALLIFTQMHTGTSLDALLYGTLINFLPLVAYVAYMLFKSIVFLGFNGDTASRIIGLIFPIWSIFENVFDTHTRAWDSSILNGIYWFILALVLYGLSLFFYHQRKHERAESPFTNPLFFPVISALVSIILVFLMYSGFYSANSSETQSFFNPLNFIFPFFFTLIIYLVMDTISQRSFKNLYKAVLRYLIIAAVGFSLLLTGLFTKGFGYVTLVPKAEEVSSVEFRFDDYMGKILPAANALYNTTYDPNAMMMILDMKLEDTNAIQTVLDFHKIILDEYKWVDYSTRESYRYNGSTLIQAIEKVPGYTPSYTAFPFKIQTDYVSNITVSMTYHLKNGTTLSRQYSVPYAWTENLLDLYGSEGMLKRLVPAIDRKNVYTKTTSVALRNAIDPTTTVVKGFDLERFATAYIEDYRALSASDFLSPTVTTLGYLNLTTCNPTSYQNNDCFDSSILLNENFPKTLAYLSSLSASIPTDIRTDKIQAYLILPGTDETDQRFFTGRGLNVQYDAYGYDQGTRTYRYVVLSSEELLKILPYTTDQGVAKEPLLNLRIIESLTNPGSPNTAGNTLIQPQYTQTVLDMIQDHPVQITGDPMMIGSSGIPVK